MKIKVLIVLIFIFVNAISAQITEFTYQVRLLDNSLPPTENYDFEFNLFSVDKCGVSIGTQMLPVVPVLNGVLTVRHDFGQPALSEVPRFL